MKFQHNGCECLWQNWGVTAVFWIDKETNQNQTVSMSYVPKEMRQKALEEATHIANEMAYYRLKEELKLP